MAIQPISSLRASFAVMLNDIPARPADSETGENSMAANGDGLYTSLVQILDHYSAVDDATGRILTDSTESIAQGDYQNALDSLNPLLFTHHSETEAFRLAALSHLKHGDSTRAMAFYEIANSKDDVAFVRAITGEPTAAVQQARSLLSEHGEGNRGMDILTHLASQENPEAFLAIAEASPLSRDPARAFGALSEAIKLSAPTSTNNNSTANIIHVAAKFARSRPQDSAAHVLLGDALSKVARIDEAIDAYTRAVDLDGHDVSIRNSLADALASRAMSHIQAGRLLAARVDVNRAERISRTSTVVAEADAATATEEAQRYLAAGRMAAAVNSLRAAERNGTDDPRVNRLLSRLFRRVGGEFAARGQAHPALEAFKSALKLDPHSDHARREVGQISHQLGMAALESRQHKQAVEHLSRAMATYRAAGSVSRDLAAALNLRGEYFRAIGDVDQAEADFERGLSLDPENRALAANLISLQTPA